MKTWEVYKLLTDNRNKEFKRLLDNDIYCMDEYNHLKPKRDHIGMVYKMITLEDEWEEVKTEATWQEARAWMESCHSVNMAECNGVKYKIRESGWLESNQTGGFFSAPFNVDLLDAIWYLEG